MSPLTYVAHSVATIALGLGLAIVVGCEDSSPTASNQVSAARSGGDGAVSPVRDLPASVGPRSEARGGTPVAGSFPELSPLDLRSVPQDLASPTSDRALSPSSVTLPVNEGIVTSATAFRVTQGGSGHAGWFRINSASSDGIALVSTTEGGGSALRAINFGTGRGVWGQITNPSSNATAVQGTTVGSGIGVLGLTSGSGPAGWFEVTSSGSSGPALVATHAGSGEAIMGRTQGTGIAGRFEVDNPSSNGNAIFASTHGGVNSLAVQGFSTGEGPAGGFQIFNSSSSSDALFATTNGDASSDALFARSTGLGRAGRFESLNSSNTNNALFVRTTGLGRAGWFEIDNASSGATALLAFTNGNSDSDAVLGQATGFGNAGHFSVFNASSGADALRVEHIGTGNLATFFGPGFPVFNRRVAITNSGDVVIDGSFDSGGADLAEAFDVIGSRAEYAPGDVLAIATGHRRRVEKSDQAYSTRVIGVYATQPGVLLNDQEFEQRSGDRIPVAVTGVVPTKVTADNGAIDAGDILVSSNRAGYAMRGEPLVLQGREIYPSGAIIGKALEPFAGPGAGTILVMVNVK